MIRFYQCEHTFSQIVNMVNFRGGHQKLPGGENIFNDQTTRIALKNGLKNYN